MDTWNGSIVVAIDGSPTSKRALRWAVDHAAAEHRGITLVHTIPPSAPAYAGSAMIDVSDARAALESSGRAILDAALDEARGRAPGVELHEVLDYADAGNQLLRMSKDAAMIVVGSHGRGPLRSKVLGSVSLRLVRHAECPVVVVRPGGVGTVKNGMVVGLDALPESGPVLEFAYHEASLRGLPLTVLHTAWWSGGTGLQAAYLPATTEEVESDPLAVAEAMAGMAEKYPDVVATTKLAEGHPDEALLRVGRRMDLVVVGTHQARGLERVLFGSVAVSVVEHAACPVAVVPVGTRGARGTSVRG